MAIQANTYLRFFDQVLDEIMVGNSDQGIGRLVGMLDSLALHGFNMRTVRRALKHHALIQLLVESAHHRRTKRPTSDSCPSSPTALRLKSATGNIAIMRALQERHRFAERMVDRAWDNGDRICLFGLTSTAWSAKAAGRDHPAVAIVQGSVAKLAALAANDAACFDLVCAPEAADGCDGAALGQLLAALRKLLSPHGTAIISAVLPQHMGSGWAQVCLNWRPRVHAADGLSRSATEAGLSSQLVFDATGCLVWCILRPTADTTDRGIEHARH